MVLREHGRHLAGRDARDRWRVLGRVCTWTVYQRARGPPRSDFPESGNAGKTETPKNRGDRSLVVHTEHRDGLRDPLSRMAFLELSTRERHIVDKVCRLQNRLSVIGRSTSATLSLSPPYVSAAHCVVSSPTDLVPHWRVRDLSRNGTCVNEATIGRFNETTLKNGDVITFANCPYPRVSVRLPATTASGEFMDAPVARNLMLYQRVRDLERDLAASDAAHAEAIKSKSHLETQIARMEAEKTVVASELRQTEPMGTKAEAETTAGPTPRKRKTIPRAGEGEDRKASLRKRVA